MANRKKPTNQELLNMCLFLRERLDYTTKLCEDTAFVLKTFLDMEGKAEQVMREIRKTHENEAKNKAVIKNINEGVVNAKSK